MAVPSDVRRTLEAAGVKFDENGNVIEDENEKFISVEDEDEDEDLEEIEDGEGDDDDTDNSDDDADSEDDDEDDGEDEEEEDEEVEDEPKPKKRKPKAKKDEDDDLPKLTPKQIKEQKESGDEAILEIRKNLNKLLEKGENLKNKEPAIEEDADTVLSELKREAEEYRRLRFQAFADNVKTRVNQSNYGARFDDIINSTQWEEFLNKKAYGSKIGDLYRTAIQSQDADSVVFFFDDFSSKYLTKSPKEKESVTKQDDLDDLAVPDKTKTSGNPKKRKKWDFEEADYSTKLAEAERGIITREQFVKFSDAFESALSKGRVKPSR